MIETGRIVESSLVLGLFLGYSMLWAAKRRSDTRRTGLDPVVLGEATGPVQFYFGILVRALTIADLGLIIVHTAAPTTWGATARLQALENPLMNWGGAALGGMGLGVCLVAQRTMGDSWRVGIDERHTSQLVTSGVFHWVRNPTYLGLFLLNIGVWIIWPSVLVGAYAVLFFIVMEIQVRCEEEHMVRVHGEKYRQYVTRSWRYLLWLY